jgi:site-specific recombinase XerD
MIEDIQIRNLAVNTQKSYIQQVSLFAQYFQKSPELLGPEQIRTYQVYLTNEKKLSAKSIAIAISALRFLYRVTLKKDWSFADFIPAPNIPKTLPIILSPEEKRSLHITLAQATGDPAGLVASRALQGVALPRQLPGPAHHRWHG